MSGVHLKTVRYYERLGRPNEWTLDGLSLGPVNLIVGRNATGKTRTLNVIWNLARLFVPQAKFRTANAGYDLTFEHDGRPLQYKLEIEDAKVTHEEVIVEGATLLKRGAGGEGLIYTQDEKRDLRFAPPENELAAVARRDRIQHPFLEPLHEWATAVRHYSFGGNLGKGHLIVPVQGAPDVNDRDPNQVVGIFARAKRELGAAFAEAVIRDMAELNYDLEELVESVPEGLRLTIVPDNVYADVLALAVREKGIDALVGQVEMSDGMFGALSLLIQVNYSQMANRASCVLVDDIGEGLDFERSSRLIEILRRKALESSFQLVMTTNDQFVMNHVPLEEWSVLQRAGCQVQVKNYQKARDAFEYFKFVGLSNFAFLEMDFVNGPPAVEGAVAHE